MLLRMSDWEKIRGQFSEEEKAKLNAAIEGQVLCPKGCIINEAELGEVLSDKLELALKND